MNLHAAERFLRRDDKALRLRYSLEDSGLVLVERKTFRGRIGRLNPVGEALLPDAGYRSEWGHVPVCSMGVEAFDVRALRDTLAASDSWRSGRPLWQLAEERDATEKRRKELYRKDTIRYKTSELYDKYVWKYRSRVGVPVQIT